MAKWEFILATIVGVILFVSDLVFGWLTMISGPVPVIFTIAIIIGLIAGGLGLALLSTLASWVIGILIGALIGPFVMVDLIGTEQTFFSLFVFVFIYSIRGMFSFTYEGNIVEVLLVGLLYLVVMLVITPIVYALSFVFAAVGGVLGRVLRDSLKKKGETAQPAAPASSDLQ
ncbi:MAG: hypothetical protein C4K48_08710 [Candidatus Thorarchaeota archaeon]|nr:MAG: hypothetical protein C4K48_08710 [Candidatus Thorarchaeota archaeon]